MGTRFVRTTRGYALVETSRWVLVPTSEAVQIVLTTGYTALRIYNSGTNTLIWGGSGIRTNSGNFLFPSASKEWENIEDNFSFWMVADSANSFITVSEYIA